MTATFSHHLHGFIGNSFTNVFQAKQFSSWATGIAYSVGDLIESNNAKYTAASNGTSGASAPSHTSGVQSDGGVDWIFVEDIISNNSFQSNVFAFVGKNTEWDDENSPPEPAITDISDYETLGNIVALKKISANDIKQGIPRYNWASGQVYSQYDSTKNIYDEPPGSGYSHPLFVVTNDNNIYKCINNNGGGASTNKPTGTSTGLINAADGYVWKYMGSIDASDAYSFITSSFIPVEYKTYNDSSAQWNTQQAAQKRSISTFTVVAQKGLFDGVTPVVSVDGPGIGCTAFATKNVNDTIRQVLCNSPGTGYNGDVYAKVYASGATGSGATASATIVSGSITSIAVDTSGANYADATVIIIGDGTGAVATATIATDDSIRSVTVTNGGTGYTHASVFIVPGTRGAIAKAILAPINGHGANIVSELGASNTIINLRLSDNTYFLTGATSDFRQVGLITDVRDSSGDFALDQHYIGPAHPEFSNVASTLNKIQGESGFILYLNNIKPVVRSDGQEEHIKIAMVF